jgi:putative flavoprotein involved in K+ transport
MGLLERDHTQVSGEYYPVVVVGGGQAGLSAGYHLARHGISYMILDAAQHTGDSWRGRWDSLRLFTPAHLDGLDGMAFPAPGGTFPTKDQMADYLQAYANRFRLAVRHGAAVRSLDHMNGRYRLETDAGTFEADQVVVAMSNLQNPVVPDFARGLDPNVSQLHASSYRNPAQLRDGPVLVVGAGNSGAEIALELAKAGRGVWLAGRDVGEVPFRIASFWGRHVMSRLVLRLVFHHLLTTSTPMGRRRRVSHGGTLLIRTRSRELADAGVERVPPVSGVESGYPLLQDGRRLDPANVIWCTGFKPDFSWIRLPVFGQDGKPGHTRGIARGQPGLYFLGLHFLHAMSSIMVHGVGRDARYIAKAVKTATITEKL